MKALVIGAGPTGLAAAIGLAQHGIVPRIVERRSEPSELSRAVGIMPITRNLLRRSGVADAIEQEGMAYTKFNINRESRSLLDLDLSSDLTPERCMIGLPQNRTEALMAEGAERSGVSVEFGIEVTGVNTEGKKAIASLSDGTEDAYDWIIAADGINSIVRHQLEIPYLGIDLPETWSIADIEIGGGYDSSKIQLWIQGAENSFMIALPIEKQRLRIASNTSATLDRLPVKMEIENVRRTGTFQISVKQAETYGKGRVLLAGDAAHCHSPVGGRGMNLGIDDGFAAADAILNQASDVYSRERHRKARMVIQKTEQARRMLSSEHPLQKMFLTGALAAVQRSRFLQNRFIEGLTTF